MSLTGQVIRFVTAGPARRFERASEDPVRAQTELLMSILQRNAETEYGRRFDFGSIRTIEDYRGRVPMVTYDNIGEDMNRVVEGARNVFTSENPVMFAQTSGTTGNPKYIPVTPTCQNRTHKEVTRTWLYHLRKGHPRMYDGRLLTLVSPAVEGYAPSGIPFGSTSGDFYRKLPGVVRRAYSIPYEVFEIEDYQAKYYAIMRISLEHDIRLVGTANPSSVLKMCEKADEFADEIIRDIHEGTISKAYVIEPRIRAVLEPRFRPNAQRARFLDQARSKQDRLRPAEYWPNIEAITCWKGGTVGHYIEKFQPWFDPDGTRRLPIRDLGYLSSEFRGSIPLSDEGSKGPLTIVGNFFEFVAVDELEANPDDPGAWQFLHVGEVQDGGEYYIFVTTTGGLYRYDINDVIQVVGRYNRTPEIVFLRKGRGMTNITGEKVSVNQVIHSCEMAAKESGAVPGHFRAEADTAGSRYLFRVEFATPTDDETRKQFLAGLDRHLKAINVEYKTKRDSLRLGAPVLHVMREGWYERQRQEQVASGKRAFQAKTEVLTPNKQMTQAVRPELEAVVDLPDSKKP